jgi:hypothetical protein
MIELYNEDKDKLNEYKAELEKIKDILNKHKNDHESYMKKMMKNI